MIISLNKLFIENCYLCFIYGGLMQIALQPLSVMANLQSSFLANQAGID